MPEQTTTMTAQDLVDRMAEAGTGAHRIDAARMWLTGRTAHPLELLNEMAGTGKWGPGTVTKAREILEAEGIDVGGSDAAGATEPDSVLGAPGPEPGPPPQLNAPDPAAMFAGDIRVLQQAINGVRAEADELRARVENLERKSEEWVLVPYVDQLGQKIDDLAHLVYEQGAMMQNATAVIAGITETVGKLVVDEPAPAEESAPQDGPASVGGATVVGP